MKAYIDGFTLELLTLFCLSTCLFLLFGREDTQFALFKEIIFLKSLKLYISILYSFDELKVARSVFAKSYIDDLAPHFAVRGCFALTVRCTPVRLKKESHFSILS